MHQSTCSRCTKGRAVLVLLASWIQCRTLGSAVVLGGTSWHQKKRHSRFTVAAVSPSQKHELYTLYTVLQESSSRHGLGGQFLMEEDSRCKEPVNGSKKSKESRADANDTVLDLTWGDKKEKGLRLSQTRMISWAWSNTENQHIVTFTSYYQMYSYAFLLPANGFRLWKVSRQADGLPAFWKNSSSISRLMCFMLIFHTLKAWGFDFADMPLAKPRPRVFVHWDKVTRLDPAIMPYYVSTQHVFPYRTSGEKKAIAWHLEFLKFHPGHWHDMLQRALSFVLPGSGWDHRPVQRWHWWEELTKAPNKSIQIIHSKFKFRWHQKELLMLYVVAHLTHSPP